MRRWKLFILFLGIAGTASLALVSQFPFFPPPPPLSPEDEIAAEALRCCFEFPEEIISDARAGNQVAQFEVGVAFAESGGDSRDPNPEAVQWLLMAAESGHAMAQNEIGVIYQLGLYGEDIIHERAMEWFELAAAQGDEYAHYNLARYYADGIGIERNEVRANQHFQASASADHGPAMIELSYRAIEGIGMERNFDVAERLMTRTKYTYGPRDFLLDHFKEPDTILAAGAITPVLEYQVHKNGSLWSDEAYKLGMTIIYHEDMDEEEIRSIWTEHLQRQTGEEKNVSKVLADIFTPDRLAASIAEADYWSDPKLAFQLFRTAALMTHGGAQYELGISYRDGRGTDVDPDEARYWFERAGQSGALPHQEGRDTLTPIK